MIAISYEPQYLNIFQLWNQQKIENSYPKTVSQKVLNDPQSLSKIETIKLLNDSIDRLESTIKDLSQDSAKNLPSSESINTLLNTTQELANSVVTPTPVIQDSVEEKKVIPSASVKPEETKAIPPAPVNNTPSSTKPESRKPRVESNSKPRVKNVVRSKKKKNQSLTIIGITAIALALIALIWLGFPQIKAAVSPLPKNSSPDSEVASQPFVPKDTSSDQGVIYRDESIPEIVNIPVSNPQVDTDRVLEDSLPLNTEVTDPNAELETPEIDIPQDLSSPGRAKNLKIQTIEPELTFTPEQTLIATLQTKLAEITDDYDSSLFNNIRVDSAENRLVVEITNDWYELNESRQNKLANEILKRSRQLDFGKLQIQDNAETVVARNPVVGDRAIIIQNTKND